VRPKYVHSSFKGVKIAPLPDLPLAKSNAGAGLLSHLMISKWVDHLPYYRQRQIFKRQGIDISASTINNWFMNLSDLLKPLYQKLVKRVQQCNYLQADESPIRILEKNIHNKQSRLGYHWVYHAPNKGLVVFDFQKTRSSSGPTAFLKQFSGHLQSDGYKVYRKLQLNGKIEHLVCWAHARRYFEKALDNDRSRAHTVLQYIKQLYQIEAQIRDQQDWTTEQIKQYRQQQAKPLLEKLRSWLMHNKNRVLPKSKIGKAINYTLSLWQELNLYVTVGYLHIDNNAVENKIRPLAIGRKNYLFAGNSRAAQNAAMFYSFFATCKVNEVEPFYWLREVIAKIKTQKMSKLHKLLPNKWQPETV